MTGRVGPSVGRVDILHQLLDYTTQSYYPEVLEVERHGGWVRRKGERKATIPVGQAFCLAAKGRR